jgi:hypothetical protein
MVRSAGDKNICQKNTNSGVYIIFYTLHFTV